DEDHLAPLTFAPTDLRHPIFDAVGGAATLALAEVSQSARFDASDPSSVIARFSNGAPALIDEPIGAGRLLLFASDLNNEWNNVPLHPVFAPLIHEIVAYLAAPSIARVEYVAGERSDPRTDAPG